MKIFCFILCFFVLLKLSKEEIFVNEPKSNLASSVVEIFDKVMKSQVVSVNVIALGPLTLRDFRDFFFFKLEEFPVRLETLENMKAIGSRRRFFSVFLIENFDDFFKVHSRLTRHLFHVNGFFLFVIVDNAMTNEELKAIFDACWDIGIFNVEVVFTDENGSVLVKTFIPFDEKICFDTIPATVNEFKDGKFVRDTQSIFANKLTDLHNCPVRISTTTNVEPFIFFDEKTKKLSGRTVKLIDTLSELIRFHADYTYIGVSGSFYPNGSASGALKALLDNKADISFSNWWLKTSRLQWLSSSAAYSSDQIVFLVPPGRDLNSIEKLVFPFSNASWLCIVIVLLISMLVIAIVKVQNERISSFVFGLRNSSPFFNLFIGFVGDSQSILPTTNFARYLLMMFLLYTMVIRTLYQGYYYELLKSNIRIKEVQTISEMIERDYKFIVLPGSEDLYTEFESTQHRWRFFVKFSEFFQSKIFSRMLKVSLKQGNDYVEQLKTDPSLKLAFGKSLDAAYYINQISNTSRATICSEVFMTVPIVIYARQEFYLLNTINERIQQLSASGLIDFWASQDVNIGLLKAKEIFYPKVLNFKEFKGSFYVLSIGCVLGVLVFMFELFTSRLKVRLNLVCW